MYSYTKIAAKKALKWSLYSYGFFILTKFGYSFLFFGTSLSSFEIVSIFTGLVSLFPFLFLGLWGWFNFFKKDSFSERNVENEIFFSESAPVIKSNTATNEPDTATLNGISDSNKSL